MEQAQSKYPNPKDYQSNEKLLLDYTFACGRTDAIKDIITFLEDQKNVAQTINERETRNEKYAI